MTTLSKLKNNFGIGKWQLKFGRINTNTSGQTHSEDP